MLGSHCSRESQSQSRLAELLTFFSLVSWSLTSLFSTNMAISETNIFVVFTGLRCADEVMTVYKGTGTNDDVLTGDQLKRLARHRYSAQGQSLLDPYMQVTYNWWLHFEADGMVYIQSSQVIKLSDWCVRSVKWMALHVLIADVWRKASSYHRKSAILLLDDAVLSLCCFTHFSSLLLFRCMFYNVQGFVACFFLKLQMHVLCCIKQDGRIADGLHVLRKHSHVVPLIHASKSCCLARNFLNRMVHWSFLKCSKVYLCS